MISFIYIFSNIYSTMRLDYKLPMDIQIIGVFTLCILLNENVLHQYVLFPPTATVLPTLYKLYKCTNPTHDSLYYAWPWGFCSGLCRPICSHKVAQHMSGEQYNSTQQETSFLVGGFSYSNTVYSDRNTVPVTRRTQDDHYLLLSPQCHDNFR